MCYPHEAMPENRTDYDEVIWVVRLVCSGKLKACANTNQTHAHTTCCSHVGCQSRFVDQWRQERLKNERTLLSRHIKKRNEKRRHVTNAGLSWSKQGRYTIPFSHHPTCFTDPVLSYEVCVVEVIPN